MVVGGAGATVAAETAGQYMLGGFDRSTGGTCQRGGLAMSTKFTTGVLPGPPASDSPWVGSRDPWLTVPQLYLTRSHSV